MGEFSPRERLSITLPKRLKRQVKEYATDIDVSMNDVICDAIKDHMDRVNHHYSAPDLVMERMNQLLISQMNVVKELRELKDSIQERVSD